MSSVENYCKETDIKPFLVYIYIYALVWYRMHSRTGSARTVGVATDTGARESEITAALPVHTKSREGRESHNYRYTFYYDY